MRSTILCRPALLWFVPLVITLHNLEELAGMPAVLTNFTGQAPAWLVSQLPPGIFPPGPQQFVLALLFVTVLPYLFVIFGSRQSERGPATLLLTGIMMVMLVNVFSHLLSASWLGGYVPGLLTSLGIILPFGLFYFYQGLRGGWLRWNDFAVLLPLAVVLHGPGLFGLMWVSAWLVRFM
jgi:hypothetical protein